MTQNEDKSQTGRQIRLSSWTDFVMESSVCTSFHSFRSAAEQHKGRFDRAEATDLYLNIKLVLGRMLQIYSLTQFSRNTHRQLWAQWISIALDVRTVDTRIILYPRHVPTLFAVTSDPCVEHARRETDRRCCTSTGQPLTIENHVFVSRIPNRLHFTILFYTFFRHFSRCEIIKSTARQ